MILLPKFKDIFIRHGQPSIGSRIRGEYKAVLRGSDGRIKYESGWEPNTILNNGLYALCVGWASPLTDRAYAGTSDAPIDVTQTGLQGTNLGLRSSRSSLSSSVGPAPDYMQTGVFRHIWNTGVGTGLIKEVTIGHNAAYNPLTQGSVRFVLAVPIDKLEGDQLTIDHKVFWYPEINDQSGTLDISGVSYDWVMRSTMLDAAVGTPSSLTIGGQHNLGMDGPLTDVTTYPTYLSIAGALANSTGGTGTNSAWSSADFIYGVDTVMANISIFLIPYQGYYASHAIGTQFSVDKTIGGGGIEKLNTHVLTIGAKATVSRYTEP
jgi:hypothetical protein